MNIFYFVKLGVDFKNNRILLISNNTIERRQTRKTNIKAFLKDDENSWNFRFLLFRELSPFTTFSV